MKGIYFSLMSPAGGKSSGSCSSRGQKRPFSRVRRPTHPGGRGSGSSSRLGWPAWASVTEPMASVSALPASALLPLLPELFPEPLQVDLPEGGGPRACHLVRRHGLHALLDRGKDRHLIVQELVRDDLLVQLPCRHLFRGLGAVELEALGLRLLEGPLHFDPHPVVRPGSCCPPHPHPS